MDKKGQLKIQEMAFVLVAILILFALVALIVFKIGFSKLQTGVEDQRAEEANELVRKMMNTPEFALTREGQPYCDSCVDFDKVMALKERTEYKDFWGLDYLVVEKLYPKSAGECSKASYPDCKSITLVSNNNFTGQASSAFVALCRIDNQKGGNGGYKCDIGRIIASGKDVK